jgi:hypothetical protein
MRRRRTLVGALVTTRPRFRGKPLPRVETLSSLDESIDGQDAIACCDLEPTGHLMSNNLPPVFPKNTAHYPDHLGPSGLKLPLRLSRSAVLRDGKFTGPRADPGLQRNTLSPRALPWLEGITSANDSEKIPLF